MDVPREALRFSGIERATDVFVKNPLGQRPPTLNRTGCPRIAHIGNVRRFFHGNLATRARRVHAGPDKDLNNGSRMGTDMTTAEMRFADCDRALGRQCLGQRAWAYPPTKALVGDRCCAAEGH